jgi:hypothetical protein
VATTQLIRLLDVRLTVGIHAIPMSCHTRPGRVTAHGTRPQLIAG